jgi:Protein of unknown function (DUF3592)
MGWAHLDLVRVSRDGFSGLGLPVIILTALLFAAVGLWGLIHNVRRHLTWPAATGTVVGHRPADTNARLLTPVIAFKTHDGRSVQGGDRIGTRRGRYSVGKQVRVRYDARNPGRLIVGYHGTLVFGALFVWCLGVVVLLTFM